MDIFSSTAFFTVCNVAYLPKVHVLAESLFLHNSIKLNVYIIDRKRFLHTITNYANYIWIEDLIIPNFNEMAFKYDIIELSTSLKPFLAIHLLKSFSKVIFFDPDVMIYNSLISIVSLLDKHPVVITPHYDSPKIDGNIDDEKLMRFGVYNLGFFAVNDSNNSHLFLNWWSERCFNNCFNDSQFGIFTDQKWVGIATCFFHFIYVSNNPGFNLSFWNIDQRVITKKNGFYYVNDNYPLVFLHYSSFPNGNASSLSKRNFSIGSNSQSIISELVINYSNLLCKYKISDNLIKYAYDYMDDGSYISPTFRRAYAACKDFFPTGTNPFDSNGPIAKFRRVNHLYCKDNKPYNVKGYDSIKNNSMKFSIIFFLMRFLLLIIGPNSFMNFSRLLVFLSSYHRNQSMWKK